MKLIKIRGNTKDVVYSKHHDFYEFVYGNCSTAIIESTFNGVENGCTFQSSYRVYRNKQGRLYCNVRRKRVFLDDLGYVEE